MRQPLKLGELRTKYRSPVRGSNAAWDSNWELDIRAGCQGMTCNGAAFFTAALTGDASPPPECAATPINIRAIMLRIAFPCCSSMASQRTDLLIGTN
jgi:hypothetical protein